MYHLYHTPALVIGNSPRGEGSKVFSLFTRELGLIRAMATSVREERSKLRYGLQEFSLSEVTLVRGKEFWRVTNVTLLENLHTAFRDVPDAALMFARVFRLLQRLVVGEERHEELFATVSEAFSFLKTLPDANLANQDANAANVAGSVDSPAIRRFASRVAEVEIVLVLRILYLLGYLAPRGEFGRVLSDISLWDEALLTEARVFRTRALSDINHSLRQSQL